VSRRLGGLAAIAAAALLAASAQPADASRSLRVGIFDQAQTLYGPGWKVFSLFDTLHVALVRLNLQWGGPHGVARARPKRPADPADTAYDWARYDAAVTKAAAHGIKVVFSIVGTPVWANGHRAATVAPSRASDLRSFAYAAAKRYGGAYRAADGTTLPAVHDWLAWNEPNNPVFLTPQYTRRGSRWVVQSAIDYARICNAIYTGVHSAGVANERVACGVTAPRGNNDPSSSRPSVAPLAFMLAAKNAGLRRFDAWAHHPYYTGPADDPSRVPVGVGTPTSAAITLGNIGELTSLLTRLYGRKPLWITEYGFQTNPPDKLFGVSWAKQASYLTEAFGIARRNPQIAMMLWFLLRDEPSVGGWQSGLLTRTGAKKPAFNVFRALPRG